MKRSEMLLNIASELVHEYTNFMNFDKAQEMAEMILSLVEKAGMTPPQYRTPRLTAQGIYEDYMDWEPEELFSIDPVEYEKWKKNETK